ncbi:MAG: hypothetical protein A2V45_10850 [Candidatus Aminicenantes bacterium RBG_19FT_COMBO_58_17]|nr:MAG: hypothetical protein A2V45_10850 [Candidatus Aminicenantes bacterium RBG_19FT_COMBO_58_17]
MRKGLILLSVVVLAVSLSAQVRTGSISGKVADPDGNALPGVAVTLTSNVIAAVTSVTTDEGQFRFLALPPAKDYELKVELTGFKTRIERGVIVVIGANTSMNIVLEVGVLEEQVTVIAVSPMVDSKKTSVGVNVTQDVLQGLPTARDPWVVLQMVPGVLVDRENIGGTESGQQSGYAGKGDPGLGDNVWSVDGVVITDPAAIGASPTYFDFDAFQEMNVSIGGNDVTVQTGGIALNMITRRGGNAVNIGGRVYMTDKKFQDENLTDELIAEGIPRTNVIRGIKDFGVNVGGPIWKDHIWLWGSYGVQDIKTQNLYDRADDTLLTNYVAKLNVQVVPQNRFEAFIHVGGKEKFGRDSSYTFPLGYYQGSKYYFGTPVLKIQDEHMFGDNLLVSYRYNWNGGGFQFQPMADRDMQKLTYNDVTTGIWPQGYWNYFTSRPVNNHNLFLNYFNDTFLNVSHDIKFGVEYNDRGTDSSSHTPGNVYLYQNFNYETLDPDGTGTPKLVPGIQQWNIYRGYYESYHMNSWDVFFSDTITTGRLTVLLGLRYDDQNPRYDPASQQAVLKDHPVWKQYFAPSVTNTIDTLIPALKWDAFDDPNYHWKVFSPRLGFTYDITGDGRTLAKLNLAQYGDFMGTAEASYFAPVGAGGWLNFYWMDDNGNNVADPTELFWYDPNTYLPLHAFDGSGNFIGNWDPMLDLMWGGYDPLNPQAISASRYTIDKSAGSTRTQEAMFTLEREIFTDFSVAVDLTYRKYDRFNWNLRYFPDTGEQESKDWYMVAGQVPSSIPTVDLGEAAGKDWYVWEGGVGSTLYRLRTRRPDFKYNYMGVDLRFNKRLSNRWMFNGSFTLQDQKQHFGDAGYLNPTNLWSEDKNLYSVSGGGGSGKIGQLIYSKWLVKLEGLYQLPFDFNLGATFTAREGHYIPHTMNISDPRLPNPASRSTTVRLDPIGQGANAKLPTFFNLNLRLEKAIRIAEHGRIYVMADMFNVFNKATMDRRYDRYEGSYNMQSGYLQPNATEFKANQVLNPRVIRFGVRFQI